MGVEIERKFLLNKMPNGYKRLDHFEIKQGYYNNHKRLRKILRTDKRVEYWLATKRGIGLKRQEDEFKISREIFEALWGRTKGARLRKTRYIKECKGQYRNLKFELNKFHGKLEGHLEAEVEFQSIRASIRFSPPRWFGHEVTGIKQYTSRSLATNGRPKDYRL